MKVAGMGMTARSVAPLPGLRGFLAVDDDGMVRYFTWNRVENVHGTLSGKAELSVVQWDNCYLVASGGKLQKLTTRSSNQLETIEASPLECRQVFVRSGRVGVVTRNNEIRFSAVGDCESWENNPNDDSTGQYLEIGYKDGMEINAVIPLSRDLIIFKSPKNEPDKGTIYRLTGDFPDWVVLEAAHNTGTFSQRSVCAVGNDVYYAGVSGIASLSAVTSYGEIQASWPDRKVNPALSRELNYGVDEDMLTGEKYLCKGVDIGNQISQNIGVVFPFRLDNYAKIVAGIHGYGRYVISDNRFSNSRTSRVVNA